MTFYTIGYLGKLQYETIEGLSKDPLDAARAMGLSNSEIIMRVVIPESANNLISQLLFMFEYNVRHGSVIGIVGAGGIGYYISTYLKFLQYDKVMALLIVLFIVVVLIDILSIKARSYFVEDVNLKYPSFFKSILSADEGKFPLATFLPTAEAPSRLLALISKSFSFVDADTRTLDPLLSNTGA